MNQKTILHNGIRVVSENIPAVRSVTIGIWVGTGSRNEEILNHGVSHFIEHLMFKGTESRSAKDIAETIDSIGGQLNAYTTKEYTCYYVKVIDSHLELAVAILSDMLLSSKFAEEDIDREREVIVEEINMYEDTPDELVHDLHLESIWQGHPLGRNIIGTISSIGELKRDVITKYFQRFYAPDNIVIALAGNIVHKDAVHLAERYFGSMLGSQQAMSSTVPILLPTCIVQEKDIEQVHLCMSTAGVKQDSPEIYSMHLFNLIFGGGVSSRLFQSIREDRGLAYSVYSYQSNYQDAGLFTVYAGTRPSNITAVIDLILENISDVKKHGVSQHELYRAKEQLKANLLLGLEGSSSRMSRIGKMEITLGKQTSIEETLQKIDLVSLEAIQNMAESMFNPEMFCFTALGPIKADEIHYGLKKEG